MGRAVLKMIFWWCDSFIYQWNLKIDCFVIDAFSWWLLIESNRIEMFRFSYSVEFSFFFVEKNPNEIVFGRLCRWKTWPFQVLNWWCFFSMHLLSANWHRLCFAFAFSTQWIKYSDVFKKRRKKRARCFFPFYCQESRIKTDEMHLQVDFCAVRAAIAPVSIGWNILCRRTKSLPLNVQHEKCM